MTLTTQEKARYNRQIILDQIGEAGQLRLKSAKVLVIGAGGLGCPILTYLAAAGVGHIGILDGDEVSESNLHRQVLYTVTDIGKNKATAAAKRLRERNPLIDIEEFPKDINKENAINLIERFDIVVDGSDNFQTRYLVNDACEITGKPLVYGAIFKYDGQVSVFNYQNGPTYRCLFPEPPLPGEVPNCVEVGVLGVLPGIIGVYQANEVIKIILGIGQIQSGFLVSIDALDLTHQQIKFQRKGDYQKRTQLEEDYDFFCGIEKFGDSISAEGLKENFDNFLLIDVREQWEYDIAHLKGSLLMPMGQIEQLKSNLSKTKKSVVYCHHGIRSQQVINYLKLEGFNNFINLEGGIDAWAREIDQEMERY